MQQQKSETYRIVGLAIRALHRARIAILTVALTYFVGVSVGIVMVHAGNEWAIAYRDHIVSRAQTSPITTAFKQNYRLRAALLDFGGNLYGAVADTLGGLGVIVPYPSIAYRGWIGGIVSIDSSHVSRLAELWRYCGYYSLSNCSNAPTHGLPSL